jgi:hypothetical protein
VYLKKLLLFIVVLTLFVTACIKEKQQSEPIETKPLVHLTLNQILDAFKEDGLQLTEAVENSDNIFEKGINGITPNFYNLSNGVIYFYIFDSEEERKQGSEDFYNRPISFVEHSKIELKNVLIIYIVYEIERMDKTNEIEEKIKSAIERL